MWICVVVLPPCQAHYFIFLYYEKKCANSHRGSLGSAIINQTKTPHPTEVYQFLQLPKY